MLFLYLPPLTFMQRKIALMLTAVHCSGGDPTDADLNFEDRTCADITVCLCLSLSLSLSYLSLSTHSTHVRALSFVV